MLQINKDGFIAIMHFNTMWCINVRMNLQLVSENVLTFRFNYIVVSNFQSLRH